jgi:hypothetical protein
MKGKQTMIDIVIVLALPLVAFLGYYFWNSNENNALLSIIAPPPESQAYGTKAKAALASLKSITMDDSLFSDPIYTSLKEFHVDVPPSVLGRANPFTTPDAVRAAKSSKLPTN